MLGLIASLHESPGDLAARWWHWVVSVDDRGRLTLPAPARREAGRGVDWRATSRGDAVVLRPDGPGARIVVDGRGRLLLPSWLRARARSAGGVVFVAARRPDASAVVVAPAGVLDGVAGALAGEVG